MYASSKVIQTTMTGFKDYLTYKNDRSFNQIDHSEAEFNLTTPSLSPRRINKYTLNPPFGKPVFGVKIDNLLTIQPIDSPEKDFNLDSPTTSEHTCQSKQNILESD